MTTSDQTIPNVHYASHRYNPTLEFEPRPETYEQTLARLAIFTDAQRSLAFSPEPPHQAYASDCRAGGSCGLSGLGELPSDKWVIARFRLAQELRQLGGAAC